MRGPVVKAVGSGALVRSIRQILHSPLRSSRKRKYEGASREGSGKRRIGTFDQTRRRIAQAVGRGVQVLPIAPQLVRTGGYSFRASGGKELNFVDAAIAGAVDTTGTITLLNGMPQGTTASTRIGRRIGMKSIEIKLAAFPEATTLGVVGRWAIVLDKQPNATGCAITDVWDAAVPYTLRNISNKQRFWVLIDSGQFKIIGNVTTAGQSTDCSVQTYDRYKRINIPVQYNAGVAGTVGDIQTNALYFFCWGDQVAAGTVAASIVGRIRVRYDDS
nr:MAG TPA: capsid protein [Cressdnaviricota sp.]